MARISAEDSALITISDWCIIHNIEMIHVANERRCSIAAGKLLKRKGVKAGVPDCYFPKPNKDYPCMWIELKIYPNRLTKVQKDFLRRREKDGHFAYSIIGSDAHDTADKAILLIKNFYSMEDF